MKTIREMMAEKKAKKKQVFDVGDGYEVTVSKAGTFKRKKPVFHEDVFKLQRPMATNDVEPQMLVYNKDRSLQGTMPMTEEIFKMFGEAFKIYIVGYVDKRTGHLHVIRGVKDQTW